MTVNLDMYNNFAEMSKELGQDEGPAGGPWLPTVKVNPDFDETNEKIRPGLFYIDLTEKDVKTRWYFPKFELRVFLNAYQYNRFHPTDKNKGNRSIIIKNMREEAIDEKGGLKCGKLTSKELEALPEAERKRLSENVSIYRIVMGEMTTKAFDKDGNERAFNAEKIQLRLRGSNFMPINDTFQAITKNKKLLYNHSITVTNTRKKNGGVTYYELKYDFEPNTVIKFEIKDVDTLTWFNDIIKKVNTQVRDRYNSALRAKSAAGITVPSAKPAIDPDLNDPLDDLINAA